MMSLISRDVAESVHARLGTIAARFGLSEALALEWAINHYFNSIFIPWWAEQVASGAAERGECVIPEMPAPDDTGSVEPL